MENIKIQNEQLKREIETLKANLIDAEERYQVCYSAKCEVDERLRRLISPENRSA
jgi:hypothetical protein